MMANGNKFIPFFVDFFDCGAKLEHHRYQRICKGCGKVLIGRNSTLLVHLRGCPQITAEQAERVAAYKSECDEKKAERKRARDAELPGSPFKVTATRSQSAQRWHISKQSDVPVAPLERHHPVRIESRNSALTGKDLPVPAEASADESQEDHDSLFDEPTEAPADETQHDHDSLFDEPIDGSADVTEDYSTPATEATHAMTPLMGEAAAIRPSLSTTSSLPSIGDKCAVMDRPKDPEKTGVVRVPVACIRCRMGKKTVRVPPSFIHPTN